MFAIILPIINPVAIHIGFVEIRWYALAYIFGLIIGLLYSYQLEKNLQLFKETTLKKKFYEDLVVYLVLGILLGGRLGYVVFYNFDYYFNNPLQIFFLWEGGMSFHGALIGCCLAILILNRKYKLNVLAIGDIILPAAPIGLFLGRIANFINQELIGRPSNLPWAVVYNGDTIPRHPSELYEALLEGVLLFLILLFLWKKLKWYKNTGYITATTLSLYAIFRMIAECFREPDAQVGFILTYFTLGQILSFIMFLISLGLWVYVYKNNQKNRSTN